MDNLETLATLGTQDTGRKYMLEKTEGAIKNGQSRDTGNIGYTGRRQTKHKYTTQYVLDTTVRKQTQIK
jgi:hypothetical protein